MSARPSIVTVESGVEQGVVIRHHFAGKTYIKETLIPADMRLGKHVHAFDHFSFLAYGLVDVYVNGKLMQMASGDMITIRAGDEHLIHARADSRWLCIHSTDCTDPDKIDEVLLGQT
jgi:quercetin dioxygenase-like cupin family protein